MIRIDWQKFAANIRAQSLADSKRWNEVEAALGISHARMIDASKGKPVGTEIFLTLCGWMQIDPFFFAISPSTSTFKDTSHG